MRLPIIHVSELGFPEGPRRAFRSWAGRRHRTPRLNTQARGSATTCETGTLWAWPRLWMARRARKISASAAMGFTAITGIAPWRYRSQTANQQNRPNQGQLVEAPELARDSEALDING